MIERFYVFNPHLPKSDRTFTSCQMRETSRHCYTSDWLWVRYRWQHPELANPHRLEVWGYCIPSPPAWTQFKPGSAGESLSSRDFKKLLANSWGVLPLTSGAKHLRSFFVATNLHCRANASPLPTHFRGEGSYPSLIDQQHLSIARYIFALIGRHPQRSGFSPRTLKAAASILVDKILQETIVIFIDFIKSR